MAQGAWPVVHVLAAGLWSCFVIGIVLGTVRDQFDRRTALFALAVAAVPLCHEALYFGRLDLLPVSPLLGNVVALLSAVVAPLAWAVVVRSGELVDGFGRGVWYLTGLLGVLLLLPGNRDPVVLTNIEGAQEPVRGLVFLGVGVSVWIATRLAPRWLPLD
jgi:hypothetical protein